MTPASDGGNLTIDAPTPRRYSHRLHNFSFPTLSWGSQRILQCKSLVATQKPQPPPSPFPAPSLPLQEEAMTSPWNLRTRRFRLSCNDPISQSNGNKSKNLGAELVKSEEGEKETRIERLSVSLMRQEIEEDFVKMRGTRPHRRPKKHPRIVQRKLDRLFPGLWLCDITEDSYKTND